MWAHNGKSLSAKHLFYTVYSWHCGCWCSSKGGSQGINKHCNNICLKENYSLSTSGLNGWLFFIIITQVDFDERLNLNFTCCVQQVPWLTECTNWLILDFSKREKLYNFRGLVITCTFNEWIPCLFTYAFSPSAREGALIGTWVQSIAPRIPGKPESRHAHINNHTLMHTYQPFHWAIMLSWEWGDSIVLQFVEPYTCMHLEKC